MTHTETYHLVHNHRKEKNEHEWGDITPAFRNDDNEKTKED